MIIKDINLKDIDVLENIRIKMNDTDFSELMQSIKENGLMQPVGVKKVENNKFILIWGNRRFNAFKKLGYTSIPAIIFKEKDEDLSEADFLIMNAGENIQRRNVGIIEIGRVCQMLHKNNNLSLSEIAVRLGIPKKRVENAINEFLRVPEKYRSRVISFSNVSVNDKQGALASNTIAKIIKIRNISQNEKEKLIEYVSKNDTSFYSLGLINIFLKEGASLNDAIKKQEDYEILTFKIAVNKKKLANILSTENLGKTKLVQNLLNEKYKGLVFSNNN